MVRLDRGGRSAGGHGLDHVGVQGPLREEVEAPQAGRLLLEHGDERVADDPPLLLGILDALEIAEKARPRVHEPDVQMLVIPQHRHDVRRLVLSQQAVVHEHARELIPDRGVYERRRHARVHAAAQRTQDASIPDTRPNGSNGFLRERVHGPVRGDVGDVEEEVPEQSPPSGVCATSGWN